MNWRNKGESICLNEANFPPLSKRYIKNSIQKNIISMWRARWSKEEIGRQTKLFYPQNMDFQLLKSRANHLLSNSREKVGQAARFLTGHAFLKRHDEVIKQKTNNVHGEKVSCRLCKDEEETPYHLITMCEPLGRLRLKHLGAHTIYNMSPDWDMDKVVRLISEDRISDLEKEPLQSAPSQVQDNH
jgi:hypothetical protein